MKTILIIMFGLFGCEALAWEKKMDTWFCSEESGQRSHNVMWTCGVGEGLYEGDARTAALKAAFKEYHAICEESSNCDMQHATIEPKRLTCTENHNNHIWKCYRMIEIVFPKS